MFITKDKRRIKELETLLAEERHINAEIRSINDELADRVQELNDMYPFEFGQVVYDVQLRNAKGRFTKTKASREHSVINEVVVDRKNYFTLVDRYRSSDVFMNLEAAEMRLDAVCVE